MAESVFFSYRRALIISVHLGLWTIAFLSAFLLRFEFSIPPQLFEDLVLWGAVLLGIRTLTGVVFGTFQGLWRYTGARDLVGLVKANTVSTVVFALFILFVGARSFPRSVFIIEWLVSLSLVGGLRFGIRKLRELAAEISARTDEKHRLLIVGAGDAAEMLVREVQKSHTSQYKIVGFVDDDRRKRGSRIHNLPVFGAIKLVPELVQDRAIDEIVVAIPTASGAQMRSILDICRVTGIGVRTIPGINALIDGSVKVSQIREVAIEDLLGREPVELDEEQIEASVRAQVVLVSGAGGSIGSELCRQLARYRPETLILLERTENNLFDIHRRLKAEFPELSLIPAVADVADRRRVEAIFRQYAPHSVYHAAAHKHVPMMEDNPGEAVKNNVRGTRILADVADAHGVGRFVMISTDKAVNPTSVMGCSKRIAEMYIQTLSARSQTKFVTVRFGNVLGSAGSVIPIFKEQIARGGPVTVTHPDMRRFFMTIPEACQLVLQAGTMGHGGEIFVLDMGEPVKIVDLARDLITLSGFTPDDDVEIKFTGVRPGEKLYEELSRNEENAEKTRHPKIYVGTKRAYDWDWVQTEIAQLEASADALDGPEIRRALNNIVPEYQPKDVPIAKASRTPVPSAAVAMSDESDTPHAAVIPLRR